APSVQMLHHQQPKQRLSWGRMPAVDQREPKALGQVRPHLLVELVVVEQVIKRDKHRVGLVSQLRHTSEDVLGWIAVHEHDNASLSLTGSIAFYRRPARRPPMISGLRGPILHR